MSSKNQPFTSRGACRVMDKIDAFLEERRRASSAEVAVLIGMSQVQAGCYLVQMERLKRIHCIQRPRYTNGGRTQTIWGPGTAPTDGVDVDAPGDKGFVRQVTARAVDAEPCAHAAGLPAVRGSGGAARSGGVKAIDLFAGAGGFTEGAEQAGCKVVWAGNHWRVAVDTHAANHPNTEHACQDLHQTNWATVPAHDLLLASWCCQGNTSARGKVANNPEHDDSRATAWAVIPALEFHRPQFFVGENVVGFLKWVLYPAWRMAVEALGYCLDIQIVDAADHGVPQHRQRLIFIGTRSKHPLMLRLPKREHVPASSFIDFDSGDWQPIEKPGRAPSTLIRVANGRQAFGDRFLAPYYGSGSGLTGRSLDRPIGTITTRDRWAVIDGDRMRMLTVPEARTGMGFRETYLLPSDSKLAMHVLGNAVAPPMACAVITTLLEAA